MSAYVADLAKQHGVAYIKTETDALADVITSLASDDISIDETEDLIVALRRGNVIDGRTMVLLLGRYLDKKRYVWSVGKTP